MKHWLAIFDSSNTTSLMHWHLDPLPYGVGDVITHEPRMPLRLK